MAGELLQKKSVLAAKIETTAGTAISLAGADGAMNVSNKQITDDTEHIFLPSQGTTLDNIRGSHGPRLGRATFDVECIPGSGALPLWATALLPACGYVVSTSTYTPRSEVPGSNVKTVTLGLFTDGIYEQLHGAAGNAVWNFAAGRPTFVSFDFMGIFTKPSDVSVPSVTYPTSVQPLRAVSATLAIGAFSPTTDVFTLNFGNTVVPIPDVNAASGVAHCMITDRRPTLTLGPNTKLVASFDPWTDFENHTTREIAWALSSGGIGVSFSLPVCELIAPPAPGERGGLRVSNLTYGALRSSGDDSVSIVYDHTV